jgi:lipoprotein-anchoring transpeptidase ErfK/SrfK
MADYSNLVRGGGVSSPQRRTSGGKGWKTLLTFAALCALLTFAVWKVWFSGGSEESASNPPAGLAENPGDDARKGNGNNATSGKQANHKRPKDFRQRNAVNAMAAKLCGKAAKALAEEDYVTARDAAEAALKSGVSKKSRQWLEIVDILGKANTGILNTDVPAPEKVAYTIKGGDNLISIAKRFGSTVAAIQKSNGLDPANQTIYPGKTLRILTAKWRVEISKREFRLYLYNGDRLFKVYTVGVGRQGRTPSGTFKIAGKTIEPQWYSNGKTIPYGDKRNVLGTRWMALKPIKGTDTNFRGYGIHGTWQPESVGTQCSNGCIRMRNKEVEELFSILPYGTEIVIKD